MQQEPCGGCGNRAGEQQRWCWGGRQGRQPRRHHHHQRPLRCDTGGLAGCASFPHFRCLTALGGKRDPTQSFNARDPAFPVFSSIRCYRQVLGQSSPVHKSIPCSVAAVMSSQGFRRLSCPPGPYNRLGAGVPGNPVGGVPWRGGVLRRHTCAPAWPPAQQPL